MHQSGVHPQVKGKEQGAQERWGCTQELAGSGYAPSRRMGCKALRRTSGTPGSPMAGRACRSNHSGGADVPGSLPWAGAFTPAPASSHPCAAASTSGSARPHTAAATCGSRKERRSPTRGIGPPEPSGPPPRVSSSGLRAGLGPPQPSGALACVSSSGLRAGVGPGTRTPSPASAGKPSASAGEPPANAGDPPASTGVEVLSRTMGRCSHQGCTPSCRRRRRACSAQKAREQPRSDPSGRRAEGTWPIWESGKGDEEHPLPPGRGAPMPARPDATALGGHKGSLLDL